MKTISLTATPKVKVSKNLKRYDTAPYVQKKVAKAEHILSQLENPVEWTKKAE